MNYSFKKSERGQVMITAVMFFLAISTTFVLGVATPILKQVKISNDLIKSKQSYYVAEGGLEDAIYRIKNSKTVTSGETIMVAGYSTTISLTSTLNGKVINAVSNYNGIVRKMEALVTAGVGASFNYGIQAGAGGFNLTGGSRVNGNVYANGPIVATNGVTITGSAISANSASLTSDQSNNTPTPLSSCTSSNCITFRNTSANQDIAQSFQVSTPGPLHNIQFYIKKISTPSDITVRIVADNSGSPNTADLLSSDGILSAAQVSATTFGWVDVVFPSSYILYPGQTYWIVLDNSSNSTTKYYQIGANNSYTNGQAKTGKFNGTWNTTSPADIYFNLYLGGVTGSIGGGSYVGAVNIGSGGIGDAWAHTVTGGSVAGNLYCQTGSSNNKSCDTSKTDPAAIGNPLSDANIQSWKDEASIGTNGWTYSGNLSIGYQGTTTTSLQHINGDLTIGGGGTAVMSDVEVNGDVTIGGGGSLAVGPMKINGNLNIQSRMTIKGTIWVSGNITINSGSTVNLDPSYGPNSGVMVADGYINFTGGSTFNGSGQTGSYPLLITTSTCPLGPSCSGHNAIDINGGSGAVVLNAQYGDMHMSGGTSAKALTANTISIDGGGTVTYDSGLANLNFASGPSGGWNISSWKEVQ